MLGKIILIAIILCELWGLTGIRGVSVLRSFIFYTQQSNLVALISAVLLLLSGPHEWIVWFRFLGVCMLVMTMSVTILILQPMLKNSQLLFWSRTGFFLHLVCPILNCISWFFFETHGSQAMILLPPAYTLLYGMVMIYCNYKGTVDGPYPFLRVRRQSVKATVLWILVLLAAVTLISWLVYLPTA